MRSGNAGDTTEGTSCDQRETGDAGGGHTDSLFAFTPNYSEAEFLCSAHLEKTTEPSKATCQATCHVCPATMQAQSWLPVPACAKTRGFHTQLDEGPETP